MDSLINAGKDLLQKNSGGSGGFHLPDDLDNAHHEAAKNAGHSGNLDMFSNVLSSITQNKNNLADGKIDEQDAANKFQDAYNGDKNNHDANSLGPAAAMQALKMFQGGGQKQSQGAFLGLAMSEASKLFDNKAANGQVSGGAEKQDVVQKAGEAAMKLYFKSQAQSQGGLMGMASKFLN